jgi:hypothetical protein
MNHGVQNATGDVYFLLHADSAPATTFYDDIMSSIKKGYDDVEVLEHNLIVLVFFLK